MLHDYSAMGFYTFDCLGWPVSAIPPGGGTYLVDEIAMAVSGAAGTAAIAGAKLGLNTLAVGGLGEDMMGDWALAQIAAYGVDTSALQRCPKVPTSSSIVLTRADGTRPALHLKGATGHFVIDEKNFGTVTDARVFHLGGVGLMDAMDGKPNAALIQYAQNRGCITTVDVFAGSQDDLPDVEAVLPYTDYFIPSVEEAEALSGVSNLPGMVKFFHDRGAVCCVITLGEHGAYYHHRNGEAFTVPAFQVDVKCTCGCGDVFNAGFAAGILKGFNARDSVRLAQACSALNALGLGSQARIENLAQVREFMDSCPTRPIERFAGAS